MNDAALVRVGESLQHLDHEIQFALERQRLAQRDQRAEVTSVDQLHGDEQLPVRFAQVVDGDDVGVLQGAGGASLAQQPLARVR